MRFTKMQGLGNDYLYVFGPVPENISLLSQKLSDRHFGVGSDGMIYIAPSQTADFSMRIFNADGSEAKMCGNGIRCVGKYVYEKGYTDKTELRIETLSGIKTLRLEVLDGKVRSVRVDMGQVEVSPDQTLVLPGMTLNVTPVSVGNPHAVVFTESAEDVPLSEIGPLVEHHPSFPDGVNAEFVQILPDASLRMRVWERGSGITLACGTGACASAAAAVRKGFVSGDRPVKVLLDGGVLTVEVKDDSSVFMTGPAEFICEGETIEC
ncbi:MAG: diaminopimelate epimerase [Clostridia bacterium]|nr:diaminopimelate epimerase [Clostridia bacterium]